MVEVFASYRKSFEAPVDRQIDRRVYGPAPQLLSPALSLPLRYRSSCTLLGCSTRNLDTRGIQNAVREKDPLTTACGALRSTGKQRQMYGKLTCPGVTAVSLKGTRGRDAFSSTHA